MAPHPIPVGGHTRVPGQGQRPGPGRMPSLRACGRSSQRNIDPLSWRHTGNTAGRGCTRAGWAGRKALILGKVVLVTGVARQLGGRFVRRIQRDPQVDRVDRRGRGPARAPSGRRRLHPGRHPAARHRAGARGDGRRHGRTPGRDRRQRSAAAAGPPSRRPTSSAPCSCSVPARSRPTVKRLVVKSSTNVYGSAPRDPAVFTETTPPKSLPSGGFAKDAVEVEGYVRGLRAAPAGRGRVRAEVRQHPGPDRGHPARLVLRAAGPADRVRATTPGCSSCTRTT